MKDIESPFSIDINLNIYRRTIVVCVSFSIDQIIEWGVKNGISATRFTDSWKQRTEKPMEGSLGICGEYGDDNTDVLVWIRDRPTHAESLGPLIHELYHAVDQVARYVDPIDSLTDAHGHSESRAYLFEFIATECIGKLLPQAAEIKSFDTAVSVTA